MKVESDVALGAQVQWKLSNVLAMSCEAIINKIILFYFILKLAQELGSHSLSFKNFYLLILERERKGERETLICCSIYLFTYSFVASHMCPDQGSNPQTCIRTSLLPTELPGQGKSFLKYTIIFKCSSVNPLKSSFVPQCR